MSGLRVVAFTAGPLTPIDRVFYERLVRDPMLDLRAVVVDDYAPPRPPLHRRIARGIQRQGWGWLWFKAATAGVGLVRDAMVAVFERWHPPLREESYRSLEHDTGVPVLHVTEIQGEESRSLIRSLQPQLGVIVGDRMRGDALSAMRNTEHSAWNGDRCSTSAAAARAAPGRSWPARAWSA